MANLEFLDTTLRDGAQAEGISFSTNDKKMILQLLADFGIDLIEGGNPSSNPKDMTFFQSVNNDKLVAFGSTIKANSNLESDESLKALVNANTKVVTLFGKSSPMQIKNVLKTTNENNLQMIATTTKFLVENKKRVIYDAEQFFDAFKENKDYAIQTISTAICNGADTVVLCDTNGGSFPQEVYEVVKEVCSLFPSTTIGVHCHNDSGLAVACTLSAIQAGATHIQGTFLGFGERAGNTNLSTVIANLICKMNFKLNIDASLLTQTAKAIAEISNIRLEKTMPFVGESAFSHKAGMHSDAVLKQSNSFEHINPSEVGNVRRFLLSEMSGKSSLKNKLHAYFPNLKEDKQKELEMLNKIKEMEMHGYQFESADGSFVLLAEKELGEFKPSFEVANYQIHANYPTSCFASVEIKANGKTFSKTASGNGPVNALDKALRFSLTENFPTLHEVTLIDYKVRVIDSGKATGALTRVLITSKDSKEEWTTVGVSTDIIEASMEALVDSFEFKLTGQKRLKF